MAQAKKKKITVRNFKRRVWGINPIERVVPSKKAYRKKKERQRKDWDNER